MWSNWKLYTMLFLLCFFSVYITWAWYKERNKPITSTIEYVEVEKIKTVEKIKKVEVPVEKIVTVEKLVLVKKINGLPDWFVNNPDEQATASAVIPPYEGDTEAIATMNTKTGVGNIIAKQKPLSFIAFVNDKQLYGRVGMSTNSEIQTTIGGEWKFLRIGKIKVGVYGEGKAYFDNKNFTNRDNVEAVGGFVFTF